MEPFLGPIVLSPLSLSCLLIVIPLLLYYLVDVATPIIILSLCFLTPHPHYATFFLPFWHHRCHTSSFFYFYHRNLLPPLCYYDVIAFGALPLFYYAIITCEALATSYHVSVASHFPALPLALTRHPYLFGVVCAVPLSFIVGFSLSGVNIV